MTGEARGFDGSVPSPGRKPVDLGNGQLVASLAASRPALLSVTCFHAAHGVAELSAVPPIDERARGDPDATRRYRELLAGDDFAFLELETADGTWAIADRIDTTDPARPRWNGRLGEVMLGADAWADAGGIALTWRLADAVPGARLRFRGRLDRPALAEITELDPPRPTGAVTTLEAAGSRLVIRSTLPASVAIDASAGKWVADGAEAVLEVVTADIVSVRLSSRDDLPSGRPRAQAETGQHYSAIVTRALAYTRGCTAISTAPDEAAILADHRLLPLSWTRDAYYQAMLLLATGMPADADLVADHLRWLWRRCDRPDGRWLRSHHANGWPKDLAFQADQQLYPMLELADYWRLRSALPPGVDWDSEVGRAWRAAVEQVDARTGLMATTENAADDPVAAPFVASSQILLWYTALRLAEPAEAGVLGVDAADLRSVAATVRQAFDRHLAGGAVWLYATDARGTDVRYHDANDLPVALAPLLGFCAPDDAGWRATMEFAFSTANGGYFAGRRAGLGSAHTSAPWTLGDVQAWVRARVLGDAAGMESAANRLREVAFDDGMLPEAYSATSDPDVRIRHWFAWPGAAFAALLLLDARTELERLRPGGSASP